MRSRRTLGIRGKLVSIFVLIKVLPLVVLAWFAWNEIASLGSTVQQRTDRMSFDTRKVVEQVGGLATDNSIRALDDKAREAIERLSTDTARQVADFLYARDRDVLQAASLEPNRTRYATFLAPLKRPVMLHKPWVLNETGDKWVPKDTPGPSSRIVTARNEDNRKDFHSRPPEQSGIIEKRPVYLEITFVDLTGRERIKVTTSDRMDPALKDVSRRENTYCKAETYFSHLKKLDKGEVYVSEVIGAYLPSPVIGPYTRARATELGIAFEPEKAGYAGKENPVGKRFEGLIRWAAPVYRAGRRIGYVTLALDHTHVMEFTDHILPTAERYSTISDAASGNYAFMWDYKSRNISHPRDYFIVGYDPETGDPALSWLERDVYDGWRESGRPLKSYLQDQPWFDKQSLRKKPSPEQTRSGYVGLDCRYLNFAPQCTGWNTLTQYGGSGSFVIFWSGLWKLTTAATIPYYTGLYGDTPRGFGFVTIGANVHEFHRAATETAAKIDTIVGEFTSDLEEQSRQTQKQLDASLTRTSRDITLSTVIMILLVIFIAVWMAAVLTRKLTRVIAGVRTFQAGDLEHRLPVESSDELGQLSAAFNEMSDDIDKLVTGLKQAEEQYRSIVDNSIEGIFRSSADGRFLTVNPAMADMLGYDSPGQMIDEIQDIGKELYVDASERIEYLRQLQEHKMLTNFESEVRRRDGSTLWISTSARAVYDERGEFVGVEGMMADVSARKVMEQAERDRKAAEAHSQAKSEFLARMSHEIRTPMNSVIGVAELLEESTLTPEQTSLVKLLKASGDNLLVLINDILDISKIEAGKLSLEIAPFFLRQTVDGVLDILQLRAKEKGIALKLDMEPEIPDLVVGDSVRLGQVLVNLVGNAVKFTHQGSVELAVRRPRDVGGSSTSPDFVEFEIKDTGIGIDSDRIEELFERFSQADTSTTRTYGGSGLGLAISKSLVELMGGTISAASSPGQGSTFSFVIPLVEAVDDASIANEAQSRKEVMDAATFGPPLKVLLVDDVESNRALISAFLGPTRFAVDIATNGEEGAQMAANADYDCVLMDMEMPILDGFGAVRRIREMGGPRSVVPVIALTAHAKVEDRQRCLDAGCSDYLPKPVRKMQLLETLVRHALS